MFSQRIKELRLSLGMNQVQFAEKINVTKQSISNWENDNIQPSIDMLIKICKTYSVSSDYLLGLENKRAIDVSGLDNVYVTHLQMIADDLKKQQK